MKDGEKDIEQRKQIMNETLASMIEDCSRHMDRCGKNDCELQQIS